MIDSTVALERIEQAERETPVCQCGARTMPVARIGGVWLVCSALHRWEAHRTFRLLAALFPHVDRPIVPGTTTAA